VRVIVVRLGYLCLFSALFVLAGCSGGGSSGGEAMGDGPAGDDPVASALGPIEVPEALISTTDSSATVAGVSSGINPDDRLFTDTFICFDESATTTIAPDLIMNVSGTSYVTVEGSGTITFNDDRDIQFVGGPLDDEAAYVNFDEYGQKFQVDYGRLELECFQKGSSVERATHQFKLNTPELTSFDCRDVQSSDSETLSFSFGGGYSTSAGSGTYTIGDRIDRRSSRLEFIDGPLDSQGAWYSEDPDTGRQSFRLSEVRGIGIAVGASSTLTYVCGRNRAPRPFKQYGSAPAIPVATPSVGLSGFYYAADISTSYLRADFYHFGPDGFVKRDAPGVVGDDCTRTAPNGLNYCESYQVAGDQLIIRDSTGLAERERTMSLVRSANGQITAIDGVGAEPVVAVSPLVLDDVWSNNSYSSSGCFGGGFCSYSYTERVLRFSATGRFIKQNSGQSGSDLTTALGSTSAFSTSSNDVTGSYTIAGNRLTLNYDNGNAESQFIFKTSGGSLVIDNLLYPIGEIGD